ncbi:MAG: permease [Chloroflexi bacterium]|nr:permease [Chloroflexota bacterium]
MITARSRYYLCLLVFLVFLALSLLTIVDIRRGFLFPTYFKVGAPSVLLNLDWRQLLFLLIGLCGMWIAYKRIRRTEAGLIPTGAGLQTPARIMALVIGLLLAIDLFLYRGVPVARTLAGGRMAAGPGTLGLGWAFPVQSLPGWLQPLGEGISYLLIVWHATVLGILLGGLFLVAGASIITKLKSNSFGAHLAGSAMAMTQPFCSCCAAPVGATLYRKGAALGPTLAFIVSSPMLNITSLVLAGVLLPAKFALLRIAAGIIVGVLVTYIVAFAAIRWASQTGGGSGISISWAARIISVYSRLFRLESLVPEGQLSLPMTLISSWVATSWRLAKLMVPVLLAGAVLASYIVQAMPDPGHSVASVLVTSAFATLLMAPTWTEIPLAASFINNGLTGSAAVVLVALPAVSIPCLTIIAGALRSVKVAIILGLAVFLAAVAAGIVFL